MAERKPILSICFRALVLYAFWLLLSGKTEPFYLAAGLLTAFTIAWFSSRSSSEIKRSPAQKLKLFITFPVYLVYLLKSILLAAWHVTKIILDPQLPIAPRMIEHKTRLKEDSQKVLFAASITLTPGTITLDIQGDKFLVHELDADSSGDIRSGAMEKEIEKVFA